MHRDKLVGVLNIEGPEVEAFTPEAQMALGVLASHLAVAIENATLYRETRWYAGLLATLYEIGKETASILDLDTLLTRVAEIVKRVIDYEMFGILLLDEEARSWCSQVRAASAPSEKTRLKMSEGLCGAAVRTKEPVLVGDVRGPALRAPRSRTPARSWWSPSSTRTGSSASSTSSRRSWTASPRSTSRC